VPNSSCITCSSAQSSCTPCDIFRPLSVFSGHVAHASTLARPLSCSTIGCCVMECRTHARCAFIHCRLTSVARCGWAFVTVAVLVISIAIVHTCAEMSAPHQAAQGHAIILSRCHVSLCRATHEIYLRLSNSHFVKLASSSLSFSSGARSQW
jgi:hypothetical protein